MKLPYLTHGKKGNCRGLLAFPLTCLRRFLKFRWIKGDSSQSYLWLGACSDTRPIPDDKLVDKSLFGIYPAIHDVLGPIKLNICLFENFHMKLNIDHNVLHCEIISVFVILLIRDHIWINHNGICIHATHPCLPSSDR